MSIIGFRIARGSGRESFFQEYFLPYRPKKTIVWWLTRIQEQLDPSLVFPASCRAGLCGGCGLMINNRSILACESMPDAYLDENAGIITIKPLQNFPVVRDLLIDWMPVAERMNLLIPPNQTGQAACCRKADKLPPEAGSSLMKLGTCITCGLCVSECPAMEDGNFVEPYIFIKCRKIMVDPLIDSGRKNEVATKLRAYTDYCLKCGKCSSVCPRGLSPEEAIIALNAGCQYR